MASISQNTQSAGPQNGQLFDLVQRPGDGAWVVWVRKSLTDLGMIDREEIEYARTVMFADHEWAEYLRQPHICDPTVWIIAGTYRTRPSIETVLAMLGVKRKVVKADQKHGASGAVRAIPAPHATV